MEESVKIDEKYYMRLFARALVLLLEDGTGIFVQDLNNKKVFVSRLGTTVNVSNDINDEIPEGMRSKVERSIENKEEK